MQAFLSTYGVWILLGFSVLLMFGMHAGHGMGHGGSHGGDQGGDGRPDSGEPPAKSGGSGTAADTNHRHSGC